MSDTRVCSNCGSDTWTWDFQGWDHVTIDEDGAYQRQGKGEYFDSEVCCKVCEHPYDESKDVCPEVEVADD